MLAKKELIKLSVSKLTLYILHNLKESFDKTLNSISWSYVNTPLDKEDFLNIFLIKIPKIVEEFNPEIGLTMKTYLCISLRLTTFNEARRYGSMKHKVLNKRYNFDETKYILPVESLKYELDFSVLTEFENSVFLSLFEACRTIGAVALEYKTTRYKIERTLVNIKQKMKKQLQ